MQDRDYSYFVIPANAGIQMKKTWVPAFAGTTDFGR
jgi:hypothetical protein